jgi:hypothetical protein
MLKSNSKSDKKFNELKEPQSEHKNKFILVTGIKSKFVSGVSEHSDIKYKFV